MVLFARFKKVFSAASADAGEGGGVRASEGDGQAEEIEQARRDVMLAALESFAVGGEGSGGESAGGQRAVEAGCGEEVADGGQARESASFLGGGSGAGVRPMAAFLDLVMLELVREDMAAYDQQRAGRASAGD